MQLNRSAGSWFVASPELFEVVQEGLRMAIETDGLFNPAILPALQNLGYNRSMEDLAKAGPQAGAIPPIQQTPDFSFIQLDSARSSIFLPPGMQIDLGGIAKGWIAEKAARLLAQTCPACAVNAGGDMYLVGHPGGHDTWEIGLENPMNPAQDYAVLQTSPGAIATSTTTKRKWIRDGKSHHHLIDPRTCKSAESEWVSVTIKAAHAAQAETLAKAFLLAGKDARQHEFYHQPQIAFLAIDREGFLWGSENSYEVFHVTGPYLL